MINLTDLSKSELNTLLSAVSFYMEEQDQHAAHMDKYGLSDVPGFDTNYKRTQREIENCKALTTPILTALQIVSDREVVNAN